MFDERTSSDLVARMHAHLVASLQRVRAEPFTSPVTVAEIYQDLVPYRNVRTELGFDMNADYEHTLLRLLAGEGELARLEPTEARDELRAELDSPNPNVGLFRKFAACDVWVAPADAAADGGAADEAEEPAWDPRTWTGEEEEEQTGASRVAPVVPPPDTPAEPPAARWTEERAESELLLEEAVEVPAEPATDVAAEPPPRGEATMETAAKTEPDADRGAGAAHCPFCDGGLPSNRVVRFCPHCGADQRTAPCVACGEPIEAGWRFCIACGAQAPASAPA